METLQASVLWIVSYFWALAPGTAGLLLGLKALIDRV